MNFQDNKAATDAPTYKVSEFSPLITTQQGCGHGLDASVSRPFRGALTPRLVLALARDTSASVSAQKASYK